MANNKITNIYHGVVPDVTIHASYNDFVPTYGNKQRVFSILNSLWFIHEGEVRLRSREFDLSVGAGNWVLSSPGLERSQFFSEGSRIISIHFSFNPVIAHQFELPPGIHLFKDSEMQGLKSASERLVKLFDTAFKSEIPCDTGMLIKYKAAEFGWFDVLYSSLVRHGLLSDRPAKIDHRVTAALNFLSKSDCGINVPYNELERLCGLSRVQIDRLFKENLNESPKQVCDRIMLTRALHLLADRNISCKEAGYHLNFSTSPHFCNWFKKHTGMTPDKYREKHSLEI